MIGITSEITGINFQFHYHDMVSNNIRMYVCMSKLMVMRDCKLSLWVNPIFIFIPSDSSEFQQLCIAADCHKTSEITLQ